MYTQLSTCRLYWCRLVAGLIAATYERRLHCRKWCPPGTVWGLKLRSLSHGLGFMGFHEMFYGIFYGIDWDLTEFYSGIRVGICERGLWYYNSARDNDWGFYGERWFSKPLGHRGTLFLPLDEPVSGCVKIFSRPNLEASSMIIWYHLNDWTTQLCLICVS